MDNRILIIAGMHGSGSSLVAQWLYRCGLHVGDNLHGKEIGREYYEDPDFYNFHKSVLAAKNLPESGFVETAVPGMTSAEMAGAADIIAAKNEYALQWGWKDPRTCLFLNTYKVLIPKATYMVVFRDFRSNLSALIRRTYDANHQHDLPVSDLGFFARLSQKRKIGLEINAIAREKATAFLKAWLLYNREILMFLNRMSGDKFIVVNQELLLKQDLHVLALLNKDLKFSLDTVRFREVFKPELTCKDLKINEFVPAWLYQEACDITDRLEKISIAAAQSV
jgi:hypothetical protein